MIWCGLKVYWVQDLKDTYQGNWLFNYLTKYKYMYIKSVQTRIMPPLLAHISMELNFQVKNWFLDNLYDM